MEETKSQNLSPHSLAVYKLLADGNSLTPKELAEKLKFLPQAIYPLIRRLEFAGLIQKSGKYPSRYSPTPANQAVEQYLFLQRKWLKNIVGKTTNNTSNLLDVSFIQGKKAHLKQFVKDVPLAKKEIKFIVIGLPVTPEVVLVKKRAQEKGVAIKILVQYPTKENLLMLESWQKMGFEVRTCTPIGAHLFLFDTDVAYLGSYDPHDPDTRVIVRFANQNIATQLDHLFEEKWRESRPIRLP